MGKLNKKQKIALIEEAITYDRTLEDDIIDPCNVVAWTIHKYLTSRYTKAERIDELFKKAEDILRRWKDDETTE